MKKLLLILTAIVLVNLLNQCSPGKNIEYNIYEGLRPEDQAYIRSTVEAGKGLFQENCASCHGIFTKGKSDITNFSKEAMDDYKSSFVAKDEDNHAFAANLSLEELDQILLFLQFYKRKDKYTDKDKEH